MTRRRFLAFLAATPLRRFIPWRFWTLDVGWSVMKYYPGMSTNLGPVVGVDYRRGLVMVRM